MCIGGVKQFAEAVLALASLQESQAGDQAEPCNERRVIL